MVRVGAWVRARATARARARARARVRVGPSVAFQVAASCGVAARHGHTMLREVRDAIAATVERRVTWPWRRVFG